MSGDDGQWSRTTSFQVHKVQWNAINFDPIVGQRIHFCDLLFPAEFMTPIVQERLKPFLLHAIFPLLICHTERKARVVESVVEVCNCCSAVRNGKWLWNGWHVLFLFFSTAVLVTAFSAATGNKNVLACYPR